MELSVIFSKFFFHRPWRFALLGGNILDLCSVGPRGLILGGDGGQAGNLSKRSYLITKAYYLFLLTETSENIIINIIWGVGRFCTTVLFASEFQFGFQRTFIPRQDLPPPPQGADLPPQKIQAI